MAKQRAEAFLRDEGITTLPVDPFMIAASRDIEVKEKRDTTGGVSGMLLRHGDVFGILYATHIRSEEHTSELQSLMRISYAVFCLKKKKELHRSNIQEY